MKTYQHFLTTLTDLAAVVWDQLTLPHVARIMRLLPILVGHRRRRPGPGRRADAIASQSHEQRGSKQPLASGMGSTSVGAAPWRCPKNGSPKRPSHKRTHRNTGDECEDGRDHRALLPEREGINVSSPIHPASSRVRTRTIRVDRQHPTVVLRQHLLLPATPRSFSHVSRQRGHTSPQHA